MFGTSVDEMKQMLAEAKKTQAALVNELQNAQKDMATMKDSIRSLDWKLKVTEKEAQLASDAKIAELRRSMQESLIKSDLLRVEALAKLEIYEKTDTKADANTIKEMVGQLINAIGKQGINVIK